MSFAGWAVVAFAAVLVACGPRFGFSPPQGEPEWVEELIPGADPKHAILGVSGTAVDDIWAVAEGRKIFHYDGRSWSEQSFPEMRSGWRSIHAVARDDVWASGNTGYLAHFDGVRWTVQNLDAAKNGTPINGIQSYFDIPYVIAWPGEVWVPSERVRKTASGWSAIPSQGVTVALTSPWGASPRSVWSGSTQLVHFDGEKWSEVRPDGWKEGDMSTLECASADNDLWIYRSSEKDPSRSKTMLHFDGVRFVETALPPGVKLGRMFAQSPSAAWMSDSRGALLKWDGKQWRWSPHGSKRWDFFTLYAPPGGKAIAAGFPGDRILREK